MDQLHWQHAHLFWGLAALVPGLLVLMSPRRAVLSRSGYRASCVLRLLGLGLCVLALAGPVLRQTRTDPPRVRLTLLEDVSQSMHADAASVAQKKQAILQLLPPGVPVNVLRFAGGVGEEAATEPSQTDIAAALDAINPPPGAAGTQGAEERVILLSDGRSTRGDAVMAARRLALRGGRVSVVPVGLPQMQRPRLLSVEPSIQNRLGAAATVRITAQSSGQQPLLVRLRDAQDRVVGQRLLPAFQGRRSALLHTTPDQSGALSYRVELCPGGGSRSDGEPDRQPSPTALGAQDLVLFVQGPPRILLADSFPQEAENLKRALAGLNMPIDVVAPDQWPADLDPYAVVFISDWSGKELTPQQQSALRCYVEEAGGGLVFIGGSNVVPSLWRQSALAKLLPVQLEERPVQMPQQQPEVSVCYVLDRSGSMSGRLGGQQGGAVSKLDLVKAAVQASLQSLPDRSQVAVLVFDEATDVVVPPTPIRDREQIAARIDRISEGGGTAMAPALAEACRILSGMPGAKYLIVLTDGQTTPPAQGQAFWRQVAVTARQQRFSWTSIAVGPDADQALLRSLAQQADGKYVYCGTDEQIPRVFVAEAKAIKRRVEKVEELVRPRAGPAASQLKELSADRMPLLHGRVHAALRQDADAILLAGPGDQPLLAIWQFGVGRVAAFAGDAKMDWGREWISWNQYGSFWGQVARRVLRTSRPYEVQVRSHRQGSRVRFIYQIADEQGQAVTDLVGQGVATPHGQTASAGPQSEPVPIRWRITGVGEYEALAELPATGNQYELSMSLHGRNGQQPIQYGAVVVAQQPSELVETGPDTEVLGAIAEAGQGICSDNVSEIAAAAASRSERQATAHSPLWPFLIIAALSLWPVDVAVRKFMRV